MNRWFHPVFAFLICLIIQFLSFCKNKPEKPCDSNTRVDSIKLIYPDTIIVDYQLNKHLLDVSNTIWFRKSGPDEIKKYIRQKDTLTLRWYYDEGIYNHSKAREWIIDKLLQDSLASSKHSILEINLNELNGVICEITDPKRTGMIFFGINNTTNYLLLANFNTGLENQNFRNEFTCILNSMTFR